MIHCALAMYSSCNQSTALRLLCGRTDDDALYGVIVYLDLTQTSRVLEEVFAFECCDSFGPAPNFGVICTYRKWWNAADRLRFDHFVLTFFQRWFRPKQNVTSWGVRGTIFLDRVAECYQRQYSFSSSEQNLDIFEPIVVFQRIPRHDINSMVRLNSVVMESGSLVKFSG